jgi:hypothetical protein
MIGRHENEVMVIGAFYCRYASWETSWTFSVANPKCVCAVWYVTVACVCVGSVCYTLSIFFWGGVESFCGPSHTSRLGSTSIRSAWKQRPNLPAANHGTSAASRSHRDPGGAQLDEHALHRRQWRGRRLCRLRRPQRGRETVRGQSRGGAQDLRRVRDGGGRRAESRHAVTERRGKKSGHCKQNILEQVNNQASHMPLTDCFVNVRHSCQPF